MIDFSTRLDTFPAIKKAHWYALKRLGVETVHDLFYHFPHRYEDYSAVTLVRDLIDDSKATVSGVVKSIKTERSFRKRMLVTQAFVEDETGTIRVLWFNQRFITDTVKEGSSIRLSGKVTRDKKGLVMMSPAFERAERSATHTGRLVPVYPETTGLTSKFLRWQMATLFKKIKNFSDPLPSEVLDELHLPDLKTALIYIHFPKNEKQVLIAEKRFAFEDMFLLQLKSLEIRDAVTGSKSLSIPTDEKSQKDLVASFPFQLTRAQEKAVREIQSDLGRIRPMNRLLNGDVGSGKTAVAALAIASVSHYGAQSVFLAPTEVLARQHAETIMKLFAGSGTNIALLTGNCALLGEAELSRKALLSAIEAGIPSIIVGTHALLEDKVRFQRLALVIVDEQQRFGVSQRAKLQELSFKSDDGSTSTVPHFLSMTATPIPRTLALTLFGNLDLSLLDEMPVHKKPIITRLATTETAREETYAFIRQEMKHGRQAFVILPLVEESKVMTEVKAATVEHERLQKDIFPNHSLGLLHGRLPAKEKEKVMRGFKEKRYDILVSTAVVEVGIDVPNATIMLIEGAERFGLSQLHQFRGRVGRGREQSYCFLFPSLSKSAENERLRALEKTESGFDLAEIDLKLRGPGAFLGTRQSGLPDIAFENLTNLKLIQIAREQAEKLLSTDPKLAQTPLLRKALATFEERIHLE